MIVSKTPNIKIPVSILAVEATAGFIISTNGLTRNSDISERDIAIPLKKPATPIPNDLKYQYCLLIIQFLTAYVTKLEPYSHIFLEVF